MSVLSSELGSPSPLPHKRVCTPTPEPNGEWDTRLRVWGWGSEFGRLEKSLALCLLCGCVATPYGWLCSTGGCPRLRRCGEEQRLVLCMLDYLPGGIVQGASAAVWTPASKSLYCPSRQHNFDVILSKDSSLPLLSNSSVFLPSVINRMLHCEGFCHGVLQFSWRRNITKSVISKESTTEPHCGHSNACKM